MALSEPQIPIFIKFHVWIKKFIARVQRQGVNKKNSKFLFGVNVESVCSTWSRSE